MNIDNLHLRGVTFAKVLPLVYDESLSYYEVLCKVLKKVNEIIKYLGDLGDFATEEYVQVQIATLRNNLQSQIDKIEVTLDDKVDRVTYERAINDINYALTTLQSKTEMLELEDIRLANLIGDVRDELVQYTDFAIKNMKVTNPLTGSVEPLQRVLNYLADLYRVDALRADEYDAKQLTAQAYDALELTAQQYDYYGKDYIL